MSSSLVSVEFDVSDEEAAKLDKLVQRCGFETRGECVDNAFNLLEWIVVQLESGRKIAAIDEQR